MERLHLNQGALQRHNIKRLHVRRHGFAALEEFFERTLSLFAQFLGEKLLLGQGDVE